MRLDDQQPRMVKLWPEQNSLHLRPKREDKVGADLAKGGALSNVKRPADAGNVRLGALRTIPKSPARLHPQQQQADAEQGKHAGFGYLIGDRADVQDAEAAVV